VGVLKLLFSEAEVEYLSAVPINVLVRWMVFRHTAGVIFPCTFPLPACLCEYVTLFNEV